jgi:hypothetical protein
MSYFSKITMSILTLTAALAVAATIFLAQADKSTSTSQRKKMVFQPGAKTPEDERVNASTPADKTPEQLVQSFFSLIGEGKVDEAYALLTSGSKIAEKESDIEALRIKTREAIDVFGEIGGYEIVAQREIGTRLTSYTCVSLGKNFPLRWRFYFYRPADQWKLVDIRVDDRLADIFGENAETSNPAD